MNNEIMPVGYWQVNPKSSVHAGRIGLLNAETTDNLIILESENGLFAVDRRHLTFLGKTK